VRCSAETDRIGGGVSEERTMMSMSEWTTFRGDEAYVRRLQKKYVSYFRNCSRVLDIGCGRGEFLGLLLEEGVQAVGIDMSHEAVAACREKGFHAELADAVSFLQGKSDVFDGIFCSHVVEHMHPHELLRLIRMLGQALQKGGILVIVTPNMKNLRVFTETFWLDPTHVRPYPIPTLRNLLVRSGFDVLKYGEDPDTKPRPRLVRTLARGLSLLKLNQTFPHWIAGGQDNFVIAEFTGLAE
jgi:O-antigen chain-terminating methyltransferase